MLQGMKAGLHLIHLSRKLIGIIYNLMVSNITYELEGCIPVVIPTLSSCMSLSMSFNSEPWFLQASSTDPKTTSLLEPLSGWDEIGMEDARHSADIPASHLAGEIPLLCPSGSPGIMLLFPSHLVGITLSRQTSPHRPWRILDLATFWAP